MASAGDEPVGLHTQCGAVDPEGEQVLRLSGLGQEVEHVHAGEPGQRRHVDGHGGVQAHRALDSNELYQAHGYEHTAARGWEQELAGAGRDRSGPAHG